jgi:hypothetical protein
MILDKIPLPNNNYLIYLKDQDYTYVDFYLHGVTIIQDFVIKHNSSKNYIIGNVTKESVVENFPNLEIDYASLIRIYLNHEQTLVYDGYGLPNSPIGTTPIIINTMLSHISRIHQFYSVSILNYNMLNSAEFTFDYSMPNIAHITNSGKYDDFSKKLLYIPPFIYNYNVFNKERSNNIITAFGNPNIPRRQRFTSLINKHIPCPNINGFYGLENTLEFFKNTKIIINIHQLDTHHTLEELRVLPALLCGVIIISENVPLKETIPYSNYILWGNSFDEIIQIARDVTNNYDTYYDKIHGTNSELSNIFDNMKKQCDDDLYKIL